MHPRRTRVLRDQTSILPSSSNTPRYIEKQFWGFSNVKWSPVNNFSSKNPSNFDFTRASPIDTVIRGGKLQGRRIASVSERWIKISRISDQNLDLNKYPQEYIQIFVSKESNSLLLRVIGNEEDRMIPLLLSRYFTVDARPINLCQLVFEQRGNRRMLRLLDEKQW